MDVFFQGNGPQKVKSPKKITWEALSWLKPRISKNKMHTYINAYIKNAHWFTTARGAISEPIAMKVYTLIDLAYVANDAKSDYDRSQG